VATLVPTFWETVLFGTNPRVRVIVQVADRFGSSLVAACTVTMTLVPDPALLVVKALPGVAGVGTGFVASCELTATDTHASCIFALDVPSEYFGADPRLQNGKDYAISARFAVAGTATVVDRVLTVRRPAAVAASHFHQDVVLSTPIGPLYRGQRFEAVVASKATFALTSFTVMVVVPSGVAVALPVATSPPVGVGGRSRWHVTSTQSGRRLVVSGSLDPSVPLPEGRSTAEEVLFALPCVLSDDVAPDTLSFTLFVFELAENALGHGRVDVRGVRRAEGAGPPQGSYVDMAGFHTDDKGARIVVVADAPHLLLVHSTAPELVNTAVLDG
jgi:hypothetical protein